MLVYRSIVFLSVGSSSDDDYYSADDPRSDSDDLATGSQSDEETGHWYKARESVPHVNEMSKYYNDDDDIELIFTCML